MKSFAAIRTLDCLTRRQGIHIPIKKKVIAGFPSQAPSMGWVVICRKSEMGVVDHIIFSYNISSEGRYGEDDSYNKKQLSKFAT
jgi:hypothetical protein